MEEIEVLLVTERDFLPHERDRLVALFQKNLGHPFRIVLTRCADIPRSPREKFEEFVSRVVT
nr:hypothetical protein WG33_0186 [uncultured bacterium]